MGHAAARRDGSGVDGIMSDDTLDPTRLQRLLPISVWLRGIGATGSEPIWWRV